MTRDDDEVVQSFSRLRCWTRGGERAPHKPLLLLMALAKLQRGEDRWLEYEQIEEPLRRLLREFGPQRKSYHPEYPFWRLQADGLWTIPDRARFEVHRRGGNREPLPTALRRYHARGSLADGIIEGLQGRPALVNRIAAYLLEENFPRSMHEDILDAVGFPWVVETDRKRDPAFRDGVLRIYERRCGVCGYDGRLGATELGLEAAHVKWHAAGGPDTLDNGVALCVLHHRALDRGALGFDDQYRVLVSQEVHGSTGIEELLVRYAGAQLRGPQVGQPRPDLKFLRWHRKEVFREPARAC